VKSTGDMKWSTGWGCMRKGGDVSSLAQNELQMGGSGSFRGGSTGDWMLSWSPSTVASHGSANERLERCTDEKVVT
jgi:hypothetical protein